MSETIYREAVEAILKGDVDKAVDTAKKGIDTGMDPLDLMNNGFISGINHVKHWRISTVQQNQSKGKRFCY